jgi:hypothetical protein
MKTTEAQLRAIKKWRNNNREKFNEKAKVSSMKYYNENKEKVLKQKQIYYLKKKVEKQEEELLKQLINIENEIFSEIIEDI